ncbi:MAG: hypothetical protein JO101_04560 [Candidatus Eremiobacteraeota bacterium]|nr:hypothetical protein [Candidatus Eremiobacteraeota bacterium]MBV8354570.1 hypothetical protein [Candidatus Eremiobacteraeota bacterium]
MIRRITLAAAIVLLAAPALADPTAAPSPAPVVPVPNLPKSIQNSPYGQAASEIIQGALARQRFVHQNGAHGAVTYYKGYALQVEVPSTPFAPVIYRNVHLHKGTVINPRGITLQPGMIVDVSGQAEPDGSLRGDYITVVQ